MSQLTSATARMRAYFYRDRTQSLGEEIANSVSHGVGFLAAVAAVPILVAAAVKSGDPVAIAGVSVFATTLVMVYLASTIYHALPRNRAKHVMRLVDHAAVFLLIAGTYTPFTLSVLGGGWGWTVFGLVWAVGISGLVFTSLLGGFRYPLVALGLYLVTGWIAVIAIKPILATMPAWCLFWIAAGGLAYTVGVPFYAMERFRYSHFVWHLCVMIGSACHVFAVLNITA